MSIRATAIGNSAIVLLWLATSAAWSQTPGNEPVSPPRVVLTGRLEELGGSSKLPIRVTLKGLKAGQAMLDTSARSEPPKDRVASYPNIWSGQWGGHLTVTKLWEQNPDPYEMTRVGSRGVTVFSFLPDGTRTRLQPTDIFFRPHPMPAEQAEYTADQVKDLQKKNGKLEPNTMVMGIDLVRLRQAVAYNPFRQEQFDFSVLLNSLRRLTPPVVSPHSNDPASAVSVMEQDIVVSTRTQKTHERTYTETVVRLSPVKGRSDLLWAQVAHVGYDKFGVSNRQLILEGWLSTNWRSCATEIEKLQGRTVAQIGYVELCGGMSEQMPPSPKLQGNVADNERRLTGRTVVSQNATFHGVSSYSGQDIKVVKSVVPQPAKPGKEIKPLLATPLRASASSASASGKLLPGNPVATTDHIPTNAKP